MRILLTAAVMIFSISAFAQTPTNPALQSLMGKFNKENPLSAELMVPSTDPVVLNPAPKQPLYSHTLPSGAKVYTMPQDNMPCIVPDIVSNMPVLGGETVSPGKPGAIPNAGYAPMVMAKPVIMKKAVMRKP
jgi:hypothetical protein